MTTMDPTRPNCKHDEPLSKEELVEMRQIMSRVKLRQNESVRAETERRSSQLRASIGIALNNLIFNCKALNEYRDVEYVEDSGGNLFLGLCSSDSEPSAGAPKPGEQGHLSTVQFWGFTSCREFYLLHYG
jgi:hypothetical protein